MDLSEQLDSEIMVLTQEIGNDPFDYMLYMERGRLHYQKGAFDKALNDFTRVHELSPNCKEASEYISMIREIFAFRYLDIYNP